MNRRSFFRALAGAPIAAIASVNAAPVVRSGAIVGEIGAELIDPPRTSMTFMRAFDLAMKQREAVAKLRNTI